MKLAKQIINRILEKANVVRNPINLNNREGALHRAWGHVFTNHLEGDYVEFGVYKGASFTKSYKTYLDFRTWLMNEMNSPEEWRRIVAKEYSEKKVHFHGLDTFTSMPDNREGNMTFTGGTFVSDIDLVHRLCVNAGMKDYSLYKGLFTDSAEALKGKMASRAAIVNIDGDLYESARDALYII
jgi:O-methyltransferase